jgi:hypothetical protein
MFFSSLMNLYEYVTKTNKFVHNIIIIIKVFIKEEEGDKSEFQ